MKRGFSLKRRMSNLIFFRVHKIQEGRFTEYTLLKKVRTSIMISFMDLLFGVSNVCVWATRTATGMRRLWVWEWFMSITGYATVPCGWGKKNTGQFHRNPTQECVNSAGESLRRLEAVLGTWGGYSFWGWTLPSWLAWARVLNILKYLEQLYMGKSCHFHSTSSNLRDPAYFRHVVLSAFLSKEYRNTS